MTERPLRLRVAVQRAPEPALLRAAIASALAGRAVHGPEGVVARAVVDAARKERAWR
jgi:hypothetical protein